MSLMSPGILSHLTLPLSNSPPIKSISPAQKECCGGPYYTIGHIQSQTKALSAEGPWWHGAMCVGLCCTLALTDLLEDSILYWNWPWQLSSSHVTPFEGCSVQVLYLCFLESCMKMTVLCLRRYASHQQSSQKYVGLLLCLFSHGLEAHFWSVGSRCRWEVNHSVVQLSSEILTLLSSPLLSLTHFWPQQAQEIYSPLH